MAFSFISITTERSTIFLCSRVRVSVHRLDRPSCYVSRDELRDMAVSAARDFPIALRATVRRIAARCVEGVAIIRNLRHQRAATRHDATAFFKLSEVGRPAEPRLAVEGKEFYRRAGNENCISRAE